jgi:hypothetical protein
MDAAKLGNMLGEATATGLIGLVLGLLAKLVAKVSGKSTDAIKLTRCALIGAAIPFVVSLWR